MNKRIIPKGTQKADVVRAINTMIRDLDPAKSWQISIDEVKPRRSLNQNSFLWGVVYPSLLEGGGEALEGWSALDLHNFFLMEMWGTETLTAFGKTWTRPARRSSTMNKQEFSDFIGYIEQRAADMGIIIPEPSYEPT